MAMAKARGIKLPDYDKIRDELSNTGSHVYQQIVEFLGERCKQLGITGHERINWVSSNQKWVKLTEMKKVTSILIDLTQRAREFSMVEDTNKFLDMALKSLSKFTNSLALVHRKDLGETKRSVNGEDESLLVRKLDPSACEEIDIQMRGIVRRVVRGLHPLPPETRLKRQDSVSEKFLMAVGWDLDNDYLAKIPVDAIFSSKAALGEFTRKFPVETQQYMNRVLTCWSRLQLNPPIPSAPRFVSPAPQPPSRVVTRSRPRAPRVATPSTMSIDLSRKIDPPKRKNLFAIFGEPGISLEDHKGRATAVSDLLIIINVLIDAVLPGAEQNPLRTATAPCLMFLILQIYRARAMGRQGTSEVMHDTFIDMLVEKAGANRADPFTMAPLLSNMIGRIKGAHHRFLRKDLLLETIEIIVSSILPNDETRNFTVFHPTMVPIIAEKIKQSIEEIGDKLRDWIDTFQGDLGNPPVGGCFTEIFWKYANPQWDPSRQVLPAAEKLEAIDPIDTGVVLRMGSLNELDEDKWYMDADYDGLNLDSSLDSIPDRSSLLPPQLLNEEGFEVRIPLPMYWEALCQEAMGGEDSKLNRYLNWILSSKKSRILKREVLEMVPGCKWKFKANWYTSMKKICFHVFLHTGKYDSNPFNQLLGLKDLFDIMNRNYIIWNSLGEEYQKILIGIAPMFSILKPVLGIKDHVNKVIEYWKYLWDKQRPLLKNPENDWNHTIQVPNVKAQKRLFNSFPILATLRLAKIEKKMSDPLTLKVSMMYIIKTMMNADDRWQKVLESCSTLDMDPDVAGPILIQAHAWNSIGFLYSSTMQTTLRSQNMTITASKNPSTMWTPARVLDRMCTESFDVSEQNILDKNHQGSNVRKTGISLDGVFKVQRTGVIPIQILAIRIFILRKLLLACGLSLPQEDFKLSENSLFPWDGVFEAGQGWKEYRPAKVTASSWASFGEDIFLSLPELPGMKQITPNMIRKTLISLEKGAGLEATKSKSGHKTISSVKHYILNIPWINTIVADYPEMDRPMLAHTILAHQVKNILGDEKNLSHTEISEFFDHEKCTWIIESSKQNRALGTRKQFQSYELRFWTHLLEKHQNPFQISVNDALRAYALIINRVYKSESPEKDPKTVLGADTVEMRDHGPERGGGGHRQRNFICKITLRI